MASFAVSTCVITKYVHDLIIILFSIVSINLQFLPAEQRRENKRFI